MDTLRINKGKAPTTEKGDLGIVMLVKTGEDDDIQWFNYTTGYFTPATHVEWDKGTMSVVLPADIAGWLVKQGYARDMTDEEVQAYNERLEEEATRPSPPRKPEKGKSP